MIFRSRIPDDWRREFVVHARRRHVSRRHIAESLNDVEAHCSDAGQSTAEAFGDPSGYAEAFARALRPAGSQPAYQRIGTIAILSAGTVTALWCLVLGVVVLREGGDGGIGLGTQAVVAAITGVTVAVVAHRLGRLRGYLVWLVIIGAAWVELSAAGLHVYLLINTAWGWFVTGLFLLTLTWLPITWSRRRSLPFLRSAHLG